MPPIHTQSSIQFPPPASVRVNPHHARSHSRSSRRSRHDSVLQEKYLPPRPPPLLRQPPPPRRPSIPHRPSSSYAHHHQQHQQHQSQRRTSSHSTRHPGNVSRQVQQNYQHQHQHRHQHPQPRTLAQLNPNRQPHLREKDRSRPEPQSHASPPPTWTSALVASFLSIGLLEIFIAALQSLFCALYLLTGHAVLRATHHPGYTTQHTLFSSFKIGALGGCIVTLPAILLVVCRRKGPLFLVLSLAVDTFIGAMAGALGALILNPRHLDDMLDPSHASRAGALGGLIFSFGLLVLRLMC